MAGASITVDYDSREVLSYLRRLGEHIDDLTPLMAEIGEYLAESTRQRFDQQQAPDGTPWAPLSPAYAKRKPKNADKILVLDEILKGDFNYRAGAKEVAVGTARVYAATHQFGRDNIPARPFLGLSADDEQEVLEIIKDYVETL